MRIGIICPYSFDYPGGVQAHCIALARGLRELGHDARVLGPGTGQGVVDELPDFVTLGGGTVAVPYNGSVARVAIGPRTWSSVRTFLADGDFDIVHVHEPNAPSYSLAALVMAKAPVVATYHTSAEYSRVLRAARPILRPALEKIYAGICVSEMARRWQVEQLGGDPELIPNGVDVGFFDGGVDKQGGVPEVVFLGRLDEPRKGFEVFAKALELLDAKGFKLGRDFTVSVAGVGKHRDIAGAEFLGRVSETEKRDLLQRADIYVAPNTGGESFGIVLVEAMAAGCAVIASDIEAFADVASAASEAPAALMFPNGDAAACAEAIERLVRDPQHRAALSAAGRDNAKEFDWEGVVKQVLDVYTVVGSRR